MIEIRPLAYGEVDELVGLTRAMHAEAPHYAPYPFEPAKLKAWGQLCIEDEHWLCLLAWHGREAVGFIAVGSVEMIFSSERTIDDLGLYVLPSWRGTSCAVRLVRQMEAWAASRGKVIRLGVTTGTNPEPTTRFLNRLGYRQTGVLLTKQI